MFRRSSRSPGRVRWLILTALLGSLFGTTTSCSDATQTALITGAQSFATSLLNAFFSNLTASQTTTPVTVKPINDAT